MELGILLSLVIFLTGEVGNRKSKEEILTALKKAETITSYLEWLRRQDTTALLRQIEITKTDLLRSVSSLGLQLELSTTQISKQIGDLEGKISDLNSRITPPILSPVSLQNRPRANATIRGRDEELKWLQTSETDAVIYGQPGSGKTELLQIFATMKDARFVVSENPDLIATALLAKAPEIIIIDDAGSRQNLLLRLRHLRSECGLNFRIFAICWPFERAELQKSLLISETSTLELENLPRSIIGEIIKEITITAGVKVTDEFIRIVVQQARGKPGLAASLSLATINASGEELFSGKLLLDNLNSFLFQVAGPQIVHLLAAFACGGSKGISLENVASHLNANISTILIDIQRIAVSGVLEQTGKTTLCIQPDFLRSALIKTVFFSDDALTLPVTLCEALITSSADPSLGYLELIHAKARANASITDDTLRKIVRGRNDPKLWKALAWLDRSNCDWVIENIPKLFSDIKRAALHYNPVKIIPFMLDSAALDTRALNSAPDADMRILEDWINQGWADEGVSFRKTLFESIIRWFPISKNISTSMKAMQYVFSLNYRESDTDPTDPHTIRIKEGLLPLENAQAVFHLWEHFLVFIQSLEIYPWPGIILVIETWMRSNIRRKPNPDNEYNDFLLSTKRKMVGDLISFASENQAMLRWVFLMAKKVDILIDPFPISEEFMILYPEEHLDDDWQQRHINQIQKSQELALAWKNRPFQEIVQTLTKWEQESKLVGRISSRMAPIFCAQLAEIRKLTSTELSIAINQLPVSMLEPFLNHALINDSTTNDQLEECFNRADLECILINNTLTGRTPQLYLKLEDKLLNWIQLLETLCLLNEVSEDMLTLLLNHENAQVSMESALNTFRSKKGVSDNHKNAYSDAITKGLIDIIENGDSEPPYDLKEILDSDESLSIRILDKILSSKQKLHSYFADEILSSLVSNLGKSKRRDFLYRCKHLTHSSLPACLVNHDEDIYHDLLSIPELNYAHLDVLNGDPTQGNWTALAKLALNAGYSPKEVSYAVNGRGYKWRGNLSNYYQQWIDRFQHLGQSPDPCIQNIASEGLKWATSYYNENYKKEKLNKIYD